jgi:3-phenylpropionate/trans-cinnamate dioxygenase ferredoxin reductase subunit
MQHYKYLIIGGGMTGDSAAQGIRAVDSAGTIGLISAETDPPYDRPPLSKGLWTGDVAFNELWRSTQDYDVTLHLNQTIQKIEAAKKQVIARDGSHFQYDKLLLATGGTPRRLPNDLPDVMYYRTLQDYHTLNTAIESRQQFGVIGGGFIGSELAAALVGKGKTVTMIFPESGIGGRVFPATLSQHLNSYYREQGITVRAGELVTAMTKTGDTIRLHTSHNIDISVDCVVAGIGIMPNTRLAETAGLASDNGILVDQYLRTSDHSIFAAGDVANFENPHLGRRIRVEHEDNANTMGEVAGRNMAGEEHPYEHLPSFYSDLFDLGYEAVGELSAKLSTVVDWQEEYQEGVIYYLAENRIRGIILWNIWDQIDVARELIATTGPYDATNVIGLVPQDDDS